jgi:hypothetical protein
MSTMWRVPPLWQGQTVVVMASGPSLTPQQVRLVAEAGHPAVATNNSYRMCPQAQALVANDARWWQQHPKALDFAALKISCDVPPHPEVLTQRITGVEGYDPDPECVRTGGNSGYTAVHIAAQAGAARILLLGFDMRGGHWHREHAPPLRATPPETYARWIRRFRTLAAALQQRGVEVVNCTPGSALDAFPLDALVNCV